MKAFLICILVCIVAAAAEQEESEEEFVVERNGSEPIDETKRASFASEDDVVDDGGVSVDKRAEDSNELGQIYANEAHKKRLETIDGVEIASSYKEYVELAIGDLDDRLRKGNFQMSYYNKLIETRNKLYDEIEREIQRRATFSDELREKHTTLRDRLSHNAKMKSALIELANIAGLRLSEKKLSAAHVPAVDFNEDMDSNEQNVTTLFTSSIASSLLDHPSKYKADNNTYNQYIEMAYAEVNTVLAADKQTLIEVIRHKKDNDKRLKMLETLKIKVENSLKRFKQRAGKLGELIRHETEIRSVLSQVKTFMQSNRKLVNVNLASISSISSSTTASPSSEPNADQNEQQQQKLESNESQNE